MKKVFRIFGITFLSLLLCFCLFACGDRTDTNNEKVTYSDIESIEIDEESVKNGFVLDDFDIGKVLLRVTYVPTSSTGLAMKAAQDAVAEKAGTSVEEYNYSVTMPASEDMVKAEDREKLTKEGSQTVTLIYNKFSVSFLLKLYSGADVLYKVMFYANDGVTPLGEMQYVLAGGRATQPSIPQIEGQTFLGWVDMETKIMTTFDNITKDTDLRAEYRSDYHTDSYSVYYDDKEKEGATIAKVKVPVGEYGGEGTKYCPEAPSLEGYTFVGWSCKKSDILNSDSKNTTYYAHYTMVKYPMTFVYRKFSDNRYSDTLVYESVDDYIAGATTVNEPSNTRCDGISPSNDYHFIGWYVYHNGEKVMITFPYETSALIETTFYAYYVDMNIGTEGLSYKAVSDTTCVISGYSGSDQTVVIPSAVRIGSALHTVTGINEGVFKNCDIAEFVVSSEHPYLAVSDGVLFSKAKDVLMAYPSQSEKTSFTVEDGVQEINSYAFYRAKNLISVTLPNTLLQIDDYAFSQCVALQGISIPENVTLIEEGAFRMTEDAAFASLSFSGTSLSRIGDEAFYGVSELESIDLPVSVKQIGDGAFYGCSSLSSVTAINSTYFSVYNGALYSADYRTLYIYPARYKTNNPEVRLHANCHTVARGAFYYAGISCITVNSDVDLETYSIICPALHSLRINTKEYAPSVDAFEQAFGGFLPEIIYVLPGYTVLSELTGSKILSVTDDEWTGYSDYTEEGYIYIEGTDSVSVIGYSGRGGDLVIPTMIHSRPVTSIGGNAFYAFSDITSVRIPVSVVSIGENAFYGCTGLRSVDMSYSMVTSIGDYAFYGCSSLTAVEASGVENITEFGQYVFEGTPYLNDTAEEYLILGGVLIRYSGTDSEPVLPSVTYVASDAFKDKGFITDITFPKGLLYIDRYAFQNCIGLKEAVFPSSLRYVSDYAFYGCTYLFSVIYDGKKADVEVGENAYKEAGVYYTDDTAPYETFADTEVYTFLFNINNEAYSPNGGNKREKGIAFVTEYENVADLYSNDTLFAGWFYEDGTEAVFPLHIQKDTTVYARLVGSDYGSEGLIFDRTEDGDSYIVTGYTGKDHYVIVPETYKSTPVTAVAADAFSGSVSYVYLPESVTSVKEGAFDSTDWYQGISGDFVINNNILVGYKGSAENVVIPNTVQAIAQGVFRDNTSMVSVVIPQTVTEISDYLFYGCIRLKSIRLHAGVSIIGKQSFYGCSALAEVILEEGSGLSVISSDAFDGTPWLANQTSDAIIINNILFNYVGRSESIHIPEGVLSVSTGAFKNNTAIRTVYLSESVETVGEEAFAGSSLTSFYITGTKPALSFIMEKAFYNCYNLSVFDWEKAVELTEIGEYAFSLCSALKEFYCPNTVTELSKYAFANSGLVTVNVQAASSLREIKEGAFYNCRNLRSVTFNGNSALKIIGKDAFRECISLEHYVNTVAKTDEYAAGCFYNCVGLNDFQINVTSIKTVGEGAFYRLGYIMALNSNMVIIGNILISYTGSDSVVTIPSSVLLIYNSAFEGNTHVREIVFEKGSALTSVNDRAFFGCTNLSTVEFPSTVSSVGDDVMTGTAWYKEKLRTADFITIGNTLIKYNISEVQEAVIPESVSVINRGAFEGSSVYNIRIGAHITLIKDGAFEGLVPASWTEGETQKVGYTVTLETDVPPTIEYETALADCCAIFVENSSVLDTYRLNAEWNTQYVLMEVISRYQLTYSVVLGEATAPTPVQIRALYNATELEAHVSVKKKYEFVGWFVDADYYTAVSYPLILTKDTTIYAKCVDYSIGSNPDRFLLAQDAEKTSEYTIVGYTDTYDKKVVMITEQAGKSIYSVSGALGYIKTPYSDAANAKLYYFDETENAYLPYVGDDPGASVQLYHQNTVIEEITFANNCTIEKFGSFCFAGLTSLKKITLPSSLKYIAPNAFDGCTALEEIAFETGISGLTIDTDAFKNCTALTTFTLDSGISELGEKAFRGCVNLKDIYITSTVPLPLYGHKPFEFNAGLIIHIPKGTYNKYSADWDIYLQYIKEN